MIMIMTIGMIMTRRMVMTMRMNTKTKKDGKKMNYYLFDRQEILQKAKKTLQKLVRRRVSKKEVSRIDSV